MTEEILRLNLLQIKKNNYEINNKNLYYSYALDMLKYIGTTDAILRDDLIYDIFSKWINQNIFSAEQMQSFLTICIDDQHLMKSIGAINDDTVFTRTFSALIIALILHSNNQESFLPHHVIIETTNIVIDYYTKEMDLRGYIDYKGWSHSIAHGADVIDELAQCSILDKENLENLLITLQLKICQGKYVYIDGEPGRISIAVRSILMRNEINDNDIILWLKGFEKHTSESNSSIECYHKKINISNFLKSLYFTLEGDFKDSMIMDKIHNLITTLGE